MYLGCTVCVVSGSLKDVDIVIHRVVRGPSKTHYLFKFHRYPGQ